jgi:uncharacterized protein YndB with AHSA1/START domain
MERIKIQMEYVFRTSPSVLYRFFTTPDRLIRWFCDEVDITDDVFSFFWEGYAETATLIEDEEDARIRFVWDEFPDEYLDFDISISPVTGETILVITDYCDEDETGDQQALWDSQIKELKRETGEAVL